MRRLAFEAGDFLVLSKLEIAPTFLVFTSHALESDHSLACYRMILRYETSVLEGCDMLE